MERCGMIYGRSGSPTMDPCPSFRWTDCELCEGPLCKHCAQECERCGKFFCQDCVEEHRVQGICDPFIQPLHEYVCNWLAVKYPPKSETVGAKSKRKELSL